jgi:hypothetical protein
VPDDEKLEELTQFASSLQSMKQRAIDLHLHATAQRLDWVSQMLRSEIAENTAGCGPEEAVQAASEAVLSANGQEFSCPGTTPCPDCGSTKLEMRTYGGSWDDADFHCARCGKLVRRAWFPLRTG